MEPRISPLPVPSPRTYQHTLGPVYFHADGFHHWPRGSGGPCHTGILLYYLLSGFAKFGLFKWCRFQSGVLKPIACCQVVTRCRAEELPSKNLSIILISGFFGFRLSKFNIYSWRHDPKVLRHGGRGVRATQEYFCIIWFQGLQSLGYSSGAVFNQACASHRHVAR